MLGVFRVEEFVTIESMHVGEGFAADLALEGPRGSNKTFYYKSYVFRTQLWNKKSLCQRISGFSQDNTAIFSSSVPT